MTNIGRYLDPQGYKAFTESHKMSQQCSDLLLKGFSESNALKFNLSKTEVKKVNEILGKASKVELHLNQVTVQHLKDILPYSEKVTCLKIEQPKLKINKVFFPRVHITGNLEKDLGTIFSHFINQENSTDKLAKVILNFLNLKNLTALNSIEFDITQADAEIIFYFI